MVQTTDTLRLPESQRQTIIDNLAEAMEKHIQKMDVEYPCGDTYGWETLESKCEGDIEIDGLYLVYEYTISCRYCSWTEYWTDPVCYPSFGETKDGKGELVSLTITDEDDKEIDNPTIKEIIKLVNNELNPPKTQQQ